MSFYVGVDGGGTRLRVALCDKAMRPLAQREYGTANPNIIGREAAAALIQLAVRETLADAQVEVAAVRAVGIGVAGASVDHAAEWLREMIDGVLPGTFLARSSDVEIAMVGAHGQHWGVLILAGTGSSAYGVNREGAAVLTGGWGYLLGDEGSGFWIGLEGLRAYTRAMDDPAAPASILPARLAQQLDVTAPAALIRRVYGGGAPQVTEIAALARVVLEAADTGDGEALRIVNRAADALADLVQRVMRRLGAVDLPIGFAGGLLQADNALSRALCARLKLTALPTAVFPPVIGAAWLAKYRLEAETETHSSSSSV